LSAAPDLNAARLKVTDTYDLLARALPSAVAEYNPLTQESNPLAGRTAPDGAQHERRRPRGAGDSRVIAQRARDRVDRDAQGVFTKTSKRSCSPGKQVEPLLAAAWPRPISRRGWW
jgi:hypothetical protein